MVWGGLHGTYLVINHAWQGIRKKMGHDLTKSSLLGNLSGGLITFIAVVFAWVFFRADSLQSGISITQSMLGMNGFAFTGRFQLSMIAKLLIIVWVLPNTQQVMAKYEPALAMHETGMGTTLKWFEWHPNWIWLIIIFLLASQSLLQGDEASEFLYFQF